MFKAIFPVDVPQFVDHIDPDVEAQLKLEYLHAIAHNLAVVANELRTSAARSQVRSATESET